MHLPKKTILVSGGLLVAVLALMLVFSGGNDDQAEAGLPPPPSGITYVCFDIGSVFPAPPPATLITKLRPATAASTFGPSERYCEPALKNEQTAPPVGPRPEFLCYGITNPVNDPVSARELKTQFGTELGLIQLARELCLPADKGNQTIVPLSFVCYEVKNILAPKQPNITLVTANVAKFDVALKRAERFCTGTDYPLHVLAVPDFLCYAINVDVVGDASVQDKFGNLEMLNLAKATSACFSASQAPKLAATGGFSGVGDLLVYSSDKNLPAYYCKTRTDESDGTIKTASTCFSDTPGQAAPGSKLPTDPNIDLNGPPPPPPYGEAGPLKGEGSIVPFTSALFWFICFESQGGALGPNVIWQVVLDQSFPNQSGMVDIYFGQGIDACKALTPVGDPTQSLPLNIDTYDAPPYDNVTSVDSDGDGCPDAMELDKNRAKKLCGDDPWNPHDSDLKFTGIFTITVEVIRADTCPGPAGPPPIGCDGAAAGDLAAGSYFNCQAVLDHDNPTNLITGKAFCYTDNPVTTVNVEDNGGAIRCAPFPSANPEDCGDGLPGSPPPGPFADNNGVNTPGVITGVFDKEKNKLLLDVCFQDVDQPLLGPGFYAQLQVDAHTMLGTVSIWLNTSDCVKPVGSPDNLNVAIALGEQESDYDIDQDGCNTAEELGTDPFRGGQRDPYNKYDHMDINKDGFIGIPDDIISVAAMFGASVKGAQGNVGPRMTGSVPWAHRNGDIAINIPDDILGMAAQFGHNCDGNPNN